MGHSTSSNGRRRTPTWLLASAVFPLTRITAEDLVAEVRQRGLPQDRLWLGVGSNRKPGALGEVRQAVHILHESLDVQVVTAAVGPKMTALAGEVADAVIFTWWIAPEVKRSRVLLEQGAAAVGRKAPLVVSYIRCALLPQATAALAERAEVYDATPHYRDVFDRNGLTAADTVVTGTSRAELLPGIETAPGTEVNRDLLRLAHDQASEPAQRQRDQR